MDDHRLVRMALDQGLISRAQLEQAQREQKALADRGVEHDLWFLIQDLGFVSDEQARRLRKGMSSSSWKALEVEGYTIQGRLGSGGMGDVFRARNPQGGEVAVKLLSSRYATNQEYVERFTREAQATLRLHHPHIVASTGAGEVQGCRYLMMELVEGPSLKARIADRGPIDEREALTVLAQVGDALRYAWAEGVLHRDVKPANIILGPPRPGHDEPFCAKICDFGLAKVWQHGGAPAADGHGMLTGPGLALGTPHYMSPEQASGESDLDQRSDIYGLGASLYHALLGKTMYSGKSSAVIMYKQVTERLDLEELRRLGHGRRITTLLERMLAKDRAQRTPSWEVVLAEGRQLAEHRAAGLPTTGHQRPPAAAGGRRSSWRMALAVALAGIALVAAGWHLLGARPGHRQATPATLAALLADAALSPGRTHELVLAAGSYPGGLRLGAGHGGLVLRAGAPGVVLGGANGGPALRCEPGCDGVLVEGVELVADGVAAVEVLAGARLLLRGCALRGQPGVVVAGNLELERCRIAGGCDAGPQATLRLGGCSVDGGLRPALAGEQARIEVRSTRLRGAAVLRGGSLRLGGVAIDALGAGHTLDLERVSPAELEDTELGGAAIALRAHGTALVRAERLTLVAGEAGAGWVGPVDPLWRWQQIRCRAPVVGLPGVAGDGAGADPVRLPPP